MSVILYFNELNKKYVLVVIILCTLFSNIVKKKRYKSYTQDKYINVLETYSISGNKKIKYKKIYYNCYS